MKHSLHSHHGAVNLLPNVERAEIESVLEACAIEPTRGAATKLRSEIVRRLGCLGWSDAFQVAPPSRITITSWKNDVGLCVQTGGNMSRMYADLLKLQNLYMENRVKVGAFILPTAPAAKEIGDNVANADRLEAELVIFRKVINIPIAVFSFE